MDITKESLQSDLQEAEAQAQLAIINQHRAQAVVGYIKRLMEQLKTSEPVEPPKE